MIDLAKIRARAEPSISLPNVANHIGLHHSVDVRDMLDRLEAFERLLDGLRLVGVEVVERGDIENAWVVRTPRVEALEAALRVALGLYTNPDAESQVGYAQYRMACDILEDK